MTADIKIIGFTDSVNECDCCGKQNLKGTYCISVDGSEFYYGATCAKNATGIPTKDIKEAATKIKNIEATDLLMSEAKAEYTRVKIYTQAIKKGIYTKDDFFKKYGTIDHSSNWETFYNFAHLTHRINI